MWSWTRRYYETVARRVDLALETGERHGAALLLMILLIMRIAWVVGGLHCTTTNGAGEELDMLSGDEHAPKRPSDTRGGR